MDPEKPDGAAFSPVILLATTEFCLSPYLAPKQIVTNILGRGSVRTLVFQETCRALLFLHTGPLMTLQYQPEETVL